MPRRFDRLAYREPLPSPGIIRLLGGLNRRLLLPHVLRLQEIDLPAADEERLRAAVHPGTAAFLAPNHPEFMTDWMIDKEISRRVSPLMAHWASYEVVNIHPVAQWLWLRNNLVANAPGGGGRAYSVAWARAGHGVLLHPEGAPSWRAGRIGPLVPGVIDMAWETCRAEAAAGGARPVFVVPIVWRIHFTGDVAPGLHREMAHLERGLGLRVARGDAGAPLERRFAALQRAVLARSLERHDAGIAGGTVTDDAFFERQAGLADRLLAGLEARHGAGEGDVPRRLHALRRAIHAQAASDREAARRDRRLLAEVERLRHFTREDYGGPTLTQEQIAESLKQMRLSLLTRGLREGLHGIVPVAVAPRRARLRVPEPIPVHEAFARAGRGAATDEGPDAGEARADLLARLAARLAEGLERLGAEIAPAVDPFRRPNPFAA